MKRRKTNDYNSELTESSSASSRGVPGGLFGHCHQQQNLSMNNGAISVAPGSLLGSAHATTDVLITQPYSLPTSPVASPRPSSSTSLGLGLSPAPSPSPVPSRAFCSSSNIQNTSSGAKDAVKKTTYAEAVGLDNSTEEQDWQASKTGVRERNAAMCNNELMADIRFIVSNNGGPNKTFPAHKYVLATGSSVFFAMFYGPLAEIGEEIVVPDVEPDAFLKMLK
jgi:hypothetical protein